ncbi:MAG: hypothetical protein ACOC2N_04015 [Spirochaetota bacterium]
MQESMVKFASALMAVLFLALGAVFLIIPEWYITFSESEAVNLGWLRMFGAALVSVQGFGLAISAIRRRDTNPLVGIVALASSVEAGVLWFALFSGEFSVQALWTIVLPGVLLTAGAVFAWASWGARRKSLNDFISGTSRVASDASGPPPAESGSDVPL